MPPFAKLIAANSDVPRREISLTNFPRRLGRGDEADVCVDDRWVSRDHCEIDLVEDTLVVRDLHSKHGTFVNGRSVVEAELKPGDVLNIGLSKFRVQYDTLSADTIRVGATLTCPPR
jgi:pSer/pThr/pTyr-binding forkhead associated (FHA) protein